MTSRHSVDVLRLDDDVSERFSDLFSGALLLPAAEMRRRVHDQHQEEGKFSTRHLIYLASIFGVSLEAMARRLEHLGLLASGTYDLLRDRGLNQDVVREVLGKQEEPRPRSPSRFGLLAAEAYDKGFLSEGQVASMLGLDRVEARELLDEVEQLGLSNALPQ
jgi:Zn-dependent peptidase ImmA (M78 family)